MKRRVILSTVWLSLTCARAFTLQAPLGGRKTGKLTSVSITNCWHWLYTAHIAVGNPPQNFTALIDTGLSDVMVPSANYSEPWYCDKHPLYNSGQSNTYRPDGRPTHLVGRLFHTKGNASIASYHIGGIEFQHQTFEKATQYRPTYLFPDTWHDATLTLSREIVYDNRTTSLNVASPFQNMVEQGLLERNEFSLKLPRKVVGNGILLLGARRDDYDAKSAATS